MDLSSAPISVLIRAAKKAGGDASLAHTREQLLDFLLDDTPLPPNPIGVIRKRIHSLLEQNYDVIKDTVDPNCAACYRGGQKLCSDVRAVAEYLENISFIFAGGHHET